MSDCLKWRSPHCIRPDLGAVLQDGCELRPSLMEGEPEPQFREEFEKTPEFTAIHAFLLGGCTGAGLAPYIPVRPPVVPSSCIP